MQTHLDNSSTFKMLLALSMNMSAAEIENVMRIVHQATTVSLEDLPRGAQFKTSRRCNPEEYLLDLERLLREKARLDEFHASLGYFPEVYGEVIRRHYATDCVSDPLRVKPLAAALGIKPSFAAEVIRRVWLKFKLEEKPYTKEWLKSQIERVQYLECRVNCW
jgi:hypothetical protein